MATSGLRQTAATAAGSRIHAGGARSRQVRAAEHLRALAERRLGTALDVAAVASAPLPDAKHTWLLRDATGATRAVAQLSRPGAPDMVLRGVVRAEAIRGTVDAATAAPILAPLTTGSFDGASFAIWPACLRVPNHAHAVIARRALQRPILRWLRELLRQTAQPLGAEAIEQLDRELCLMAGNRSLSSRARLAARTALKRLDADLWRPMQTAMHGDFHAGNLLLDPGDVTGRAALPWRERFVVIDWCGASTAGQPLYDLVRIAESMRMPHAVLAEEIAAHCALLGGGSADADAHIAASLARIGANLEYFPVELYRALADRVFGRMDMALRSAGELV